MEPASYLSLLDDRSQALLEATRAAPDASVPSCPGWKVEDVLRHCASVWGWAAEVVRTGERADFSTQSDLSGDDLIEWAGQQRRTLLEALGQADPEANCWTFGMPRSVRFWFRRQALETTLHNWDAEAAAGEPSEIVPEAAADGLDEFFDVTLSRQVQRDPERWTGQSVHFHRTDGDGEWLVHLGPEGHFAVDRAHGKGDLAVRGPAEALFLWSTNRASPESLEFFGDLGLAERWRTEIRF